MPEMQPVRSSNVAAVGYEDGVLYVEFLNGGTYAYDGVDESTYQALAAAPSPGSYLAKNIKGRFEGRRV